MRVELSEEITGHITSRSFHDTYRVIRSTFVNLYCPLNEPSTQLLLEYLSAWKPWGPDYLRNIPEGEISTLLPQSVPALSHLHDPTVPIFHQEIKPEKIRDLSRSPLHIWLSNFHLTGAGTYLETTCGTLLHAAPEITQHCRSILRDTLDTRAPLMFGLLVLFYSSMAIFF
jgi:serine/threonine protein kinase